MLHASDRATFAGDAPVTLYSLLYTLSPLICQKRTCQKSPALALAYMHLGRDPDAIRVGERAAELLPVEDDAVSGPFVLASLARVYTSAGRYDKATTVLERLMGTDSWFTPAELQADPIWEPLRGYPGFRKLAEDTVLSSRAPRGILPANGSTQG